MSDAPDPLELFLADRDAPCPGCGYNLRALKGSTCPECKRATSLEIAADRLGGLRPIVVAALWSFSATLLASSAYSAYLWISIVTGRFAGGISLTDRLLDVCSLAVGLYSTFSVVCMHGLLRRRRIDTATGVRRLAGCVVAFGILSIVPWIAWVGWVA